MSKEQVVQRILSDAEAEAQAIVQEAENKAAKLLADASARVQQSRKETEKEMLEKRKGILEKRAADARLDSAKLLLREKRRVLDTVYDEAHSRLLELSKEDTLALAQRLLVAYAEDGDEIVFAANFPYQAEVAQFPIVQEKNLKIADYTQELSGGFRLIGEDAEKDLTYGALLKADREENQAQLAKELFK